MNVEKYYNNEITENQLKNKIKKINNIEEGFFASYKKANMGFTFTDLFVLENKNLKFQEDLKFIKNQNELLLTFYKYRIDQRKIPCPDCGGLQISGNSYPEIGHRSWECKNIICPSRSKSNRGKRYSEKTNFMQWGYENKENIIDKDFIYKWRKDIVNIEIEDNIYEMLIKYFTYSNEKILIINSNDKIINSYGRNLKFYDYLPRQDNNYYKPNKTILEKKYFKYFFDESLFIKNFIFEKNKNLNNKISLNFVDKSLILIGDSYEMLQKLESTSIDSMVTSPPYFNAREYSQWDNLYLYLYDMYNIIKECYRTIKSNGIFLYNIGDINSNEKIIAKSLMGEKRIPLGAYTILLFEKAGFEIVENIIWDKGETQSNRHKNDGKFTPHYQRPINSYEHMFIFRKPSDSELKVNKCNWNKNIIYFSPVIKIKF